MKRILAITLALILALTTLSAVAVSAEDYPKTGNVVVFKDDFESYKVGSLPSTWAGGNNTTVKYSVKAGEDGNKYLAISDFNAAGLVQYYFKQGKSMSKYYVRFISNTDFPVNTDVTYTTAVDYVYSVGGVKSTTMNGNMVIYTGANKLWYNKAGTATQITSTEFYAYPTGVLQENGWFNAKPTFEIVSFNSNGTDKSSGKIRSAFQMGSLGGTSNVGKIVTEVMKLEPYSSIGAYSATDETCKAAVAEIQSRLDAANYEAYLDNYVVTCPANIYQDTVRISGGLAEVKAKVDGTDFGGVISNGDTLEVNDAFGTIYSIKPQNGVVNKVKYNGSPLPLTENGDTVTVSVPGSMVKGNGTLEIIVATDSERVTNKYSATFKGGEAVNGVANPYLKSTDGRVSLTGVNIKTGNEANVADSEAGTFAYNSNAKDHRMGVVFNLDAENPLYYGAGRTYHWKLYFTGSYSPGYLQWSNPLTPSDFRSFKGEEVKTKKYVNGAQNGPSGNSAKATNYVYNTNLNGNDQIRFFTSAGNQTTGDEYIYAVPGNIEYLPGTRGVFNGFDYEETVMMHKITFDGEGTLKVKADSLNKFTANMCDATLSDGQSAKVEDLMSVDFTVTAPENKVIDTIKYVTYDSQTVVGAELADKTSGTFTIKPIEASGTIAVTYKDNTPATPEVSYQSYYTEKNKAYTVGGVNKVSPYSIVVYGTMTGEFDAFGFVLSQLDSKGVKVGEATLESAVTASDGRFAIRVVGDAITAGSYTAAPYYVSGTTKNVGTESAITVAE